MNWNVGTSVELELVLELAGGHRRASVSTGDGTGISATVGAGDGSKVGAGEGAGMGFRLGTVLGSRVETGVGEELGRATARATVAI